MKYYLVSHPNEIGTVVREAPYCELLTDNWNDFGYTSYFTLYYFEKKGQRYDIGPVKILSLKGMNTFSHLDSSFERLDGNFCSIGQSNKYYRNISKLPKHIHEEILQSLRDTVLNPEILDSYTDLDGINNSLFRFSEAKNLYKNAYSKYFSKRSFKNEIYEFTFKYFPPYNPEVPTDIHLNFEKTSFLPNRINLVVGKNGVGKTSLLANFADSLCGGNNDTKAVELFKPAEIPTFTKVIGVSFSAFDNFRTPIEDTEKSHRELNNYIYCGISDSEGRTLSLKEIKENGAVNINRILERDFEDEENRNLFFNTWKEMLTNIEIPKEYLDKPEEIFTKHLSSGQCILVATVSEILSVIEDESILLFDEPELHLHPNAISNFIRMLYVLLDKFNSYSIFSTHSPLFVQEVPSMYIKKLVRTEKNTLLVSTPNSETFGENISDIVNEVFNVMDIESNYKSLLSNMLKEMSVEEIESCFDKGLSMHALTYLYSVSRSME